MAGIARFDAPADAVAAGWQSLLVAIRETLAGRGAHAHRTVVLLPYAQLMDVVRRAWLADADGQGVCAHVPRFETTMNWSARLGLFGPADELDVRRDTAPDLLTAARLLEGAGLAMHRETLAPRLVDAAWQLAEVGAAQLPAHRAAWGASMREALVAGMEAESLRFEAAVARIALEWAAVSGYPTDSLFEIDAVASVDCLVVVRGFQPDVLAEALLAHYGDRGVAFSLAASLPEFDNPGVPLLNLHCAQDAADEASRAAACVLQHLNAGHSPVAVVANDRSLVRRIGALLTGCGVPVRDETGWKLSTTHAAAALMALLRAAPRQSPTDAVLDWAKQLDSLAPGVLDTLESLLRRQQVGVWPSLLAMDSIANLTLREAVGLAFSALQAWRGNLQAPRSLAEWLAALEAVLRASGQWAALDEDAAGQQVLDALCLRPGLSADLPHAPRRITLGEFTAWVNAVLEGASFRPPHPIDAQVVVLPLSQLLGREFGAVVVPGCSDLQMPVSPDPPGSWTPAQRSALGLPQRLDLLTSARAAWGSLLHSACTRTPRVDLLWSGQEAGEPVQPSGFVQALRLQGLGLAADPRVQQMLEHRPQSLPQPHAEALPRQTLSASSYADLRACPYRYFGLRSLGLAEAEELDGALDKRDFGNWLHLVLKLFHEDLHARQAPADTDVASLDRAALDAAAERATKAQGLDEAAFTPFAASWPRVRDGYLHWHAQHSATGARFSEAEQWQELPLGPVRLVGKIDRVDLLPRDSASGQGARRMVIDYKTESPQATRRRIDDPLDDTQLAFYAALLPDDTLEAAYVNVGEKDGTKAMVMPDITTLRDTLIDGIRHDMDRIAAGDALPALGEGSACEYCAARGLCRKDFWA